MCESLGAFLTGEPDHESSHQPLISSILPTPTALFPHQQTPSPPPLPLFWARANKRALGARRGWGSISGEGEVGWGPETQS